MISKNRSIAKNSALPALFLLCLVSTSSCKTQPHLDLHQSETLTMTLRELPSGYPALAPFHYAHVIDPRDTFVLLESLTYERGSGVPLVHGQRHQVFTRNQAESLAPELSKALNLALPHEVAAFSVSDAEYPRHYTKGLAFVHGDELHLIIEELPRARHVDMEHHDPQQVPRWVLLPRDGQRHYTSFQGSTGAIPNWIIIPIP
ncbi:MAG: hypothetical protein KF876_08540 [Nitrospira sp.]|nr:hypothetical protein [Nitrospira sp.]